MHPIVLNWLAIVVAAFIVYVLGALWFSPVLFQKRWAQLAGMDQQPPDPGAMAMGMILGALIAVIHSVVTAVIVSWSGADNLIEGAGVGLVVGVGIAAVEGFKLVAYERRTLALYVIGNGYSVAGFVIMGAIAAAWR